MYFYNISNEDRLRQKTADCGFLPPLLKEKFDIFELFTLFARVRWEDATLWAKCVMSG